MSLARFPPFPLVPTLSSAARIALKNEQVKWLLPLFPAAGPGYQRALWEAWWTGEARLHVTLPMPELPSCQRPDEGSKFSFKSPVWCLLKIFCFPVPFHLFLCPLSFSKSAFQSTLPRFDSLASRCFCLCVAPSSSPSLVVPVVLSVCSPYVPISCFLRCCTPNVNLSRLSSTIALSPLAPQSKICMQG